MLPSSSQLSNLKDVNCFECAGFECAGIVWMCWWLLCFWAEPTLPRPSQTIVLWAATLAERDSSSCGKLCIQQNTLGRWRRCLIKRPCMLHGLCNLAILLFPTRCCMYGDIYFSVIYTYISTFHFIQEICSMLKPWLGSFYN